MRAGVHGVGVKVGAKRCHDGVPYAGVGAGAMREHQGGTVAAVVPDVEP